MKQNIHDMAALSKRRSMTKKALKAERNAFRKTWEHTRPSVMLSKKDKIRKDRQRAKAQLRAYL